MGWSCYWIYHKYVAYRYFIILGHCIYSGFELVIVEGDKVVKKRGNEIRVEPGEDNSDGNYKYLQWEIEMLCIELDYFKIAIDDGWEDNEHESSLYK